MRGTRSICPDIHRSIERVSDALALEEAPEVYIVNDPQANAFAPIFGVHQRPVVILNSGLVELLSPTELDFAIGHELGHLGMRHGERMPDGHTSSEFEALQQRSRQRYTEVSADRIGLLATRSIYSAAHVMVRLASGLSSASITLNVDAFLNQLENTPEDVNREWELATSHPGLPLRLWALMQFGETDAYLRIAGTPAQGRALKDVDRRIGERLAELGNGRLTEIEESLYRLALTWLGASLVMNDGVIEDHERRAMDKLVGPEMASKAMRFAESHGAESVQNKLSDAVARIRPTSVCVRKRFVESFFAFGSALGLAVDETRAWPVVRRALLACPQSMYQMR